MLLLPVSVHGPEGGRRWGWWEKVQQGKKEVEDAEENATESDAMTKEHEERVAVGNWEMKNAENDEKVALEGNVSRFDDLAAHQFVMYVGE